MAAARAVRAVAKGVEEKVVVMVVEVREAVRWRRHRMIRQVLRCQRAAGTMYQRQVLYAAGRVLYATTC